MSTRNLISEAWVRDKTHTHTHTHTPRDLNESHLQVKLFSRFNGCSKIYGPNKVCLANILFKWHWVIQESKRHTEI